MLSPISVRLQKRNCFWIILEKGRVTALLPNSWSGPALGNRCSISMFAERTSPWRIKIHAEFFGCVLLNVQPLSVCASGFEHGRDQAACRLRHCPQASDAASVELDAPFARHRAEQHRACPVGEFKGSGLCADNALLGGDLLKQLSDRLLITSN
jgi:hypothetical protein